MKKQILKSALLAMAGVGLLAGGAMALPSTGALQTELDIRTDGGSSSINVYTDMIDDAYDTAWTHTASNNAGSTLFLEIADFKDGNSFGVYDLTNSDNRLVLFVGSDNAGDFSSFANLYTTGGGKYANNDGTEATFASGENFGWYLNSNSHYVPKRAILNGIEVFTGSIGGSVTHICVAFSARRAPASCFLGLLGSFRAH